MIIMDEKLVGLWYMQTTEEQDWLLGIREVEPDKKYEVVYRFRYYEDESVFNSDDRKSWYEGTVSDTRKNVIIKIREMAKIMNSAAVGKLYEYINDKGIDDFTERFKKAPFVHFKVEPINEA